MKQVCFLVNSEKFFDSHRRSLQNKLALSYITYVLAGDTGYSLDYFVDKFESRSRIPTFKGVYQILNRINSFERNTIFVVVSPVMIFLAHFLLCRKKLVIYNFSGLGFFRTLSEFKRSLVFWVFSWVPFTGKRIIVVQNSDDFLYLKKFFGNRSKYHLELIPGSGFENINFSCQEINFNAFTIGFVGRISKEKGILDLIRAINELISEGFKVNLVIWGQLDDSGRHGFNQDELSELELNCHYLKGFSNDRFEIYRSFNWFCLPSNGEGLSKAAIEASCFKKPLILSNVEGNRDMIRGNGFLYEYGNITDLKLKIIQAYNLSISEKTNMSETSFKMFIDNWTMEAVLKKWKILLNNYDITSTK